LAQRHRGEDVPAACATPRSQGRLGKVPVSAGETRMDAIIYLVGLIVVVMAILSFFGLH
jgi:hypothetical protein